jgi:hypothetical protein
MASCHRSKGRGGKERGQHFRQRTSCSTKGKHKNLQVVNKQLRAMQQSATHKHRGRGVYSLKAANIGTN